MLFLKTLWKHAKEPMKNISLFLLGLAIVLGISYASTVYEQTVVIMIGAVVVLLFIVILMQLYDFCKEVWRDYKTKKEALNNESKKETR